MKTKPSYKRVLQEYIGRSSKNYGLFKKIFPSLDQNFFNNVVGVYDLEGLEKALNNHPELFGNLYNKVKIDYTKYLMKNRKFNHPYVTEFLEKAAEELGVSLIKLFNLPNNPSGFYVLRKNQYMKLKRLANRKKGVLFKEIKLLIRRILPKLGNVI